MEGEISRLEELKLLNIESFVETVRREIAHLWQSCFISLEERASFTPYHARAENLTGEVLDLHDALANSLRAFYNQNREVFARVGQRERMWQRMQEIEARSRDPSRLFGNRGCSLLQDEKELKLATKELPRIESDLVFLLDEYEAEHGTVLLIDGHDYRRMMANQWKMLKEEKENERYGRVGALQLG